MSRKPTVITALSLLAALAGCRKESPVGLRLTNAYPEYHSASSFVKVSATDSWTLSLEYPAGGPGWASVNPASGTGSVNNVSLTLAKNPSAEPRELTLVLSSAGGGNQVRATVLQAGKTPSAVAGRYANAYDVAPMGWLELPAMRAGDGRNALAHNMAGGAYKRTDGTRNWTAYWDYGEHLSLWVAYPLNNSLRGNGKFDYLWGFDPMLPTGIQPDITGRSYGGYAFGGGNWTRGHQLPRHDRQLTQASVASTCYPSNLTPQDGSFNSGIWVNLENKVRSYAALADTLYVVTGCLWEGSATRTENRSGFAVKVPTHYFKALLYSRQNADALELKAAGFLLPHQASVAAGDFLSYICSVEELEKQTGIDFFPNLARRFGAALAREVESRVPDSFWKR